MRFVVVSSGGGGRINQNHHRYKKCLINTIKLLEAVINNKDLKADYELIQTENQKTNVEK